MALSMSKRKQNSSFVVRKFLPFTGKLAFFTEPTNFTEAVASFASALPANSVSVTTPAKKIMYHPWNLGGLNPYFFGIWEGLPP